MKGSMLESLAEEVNTIMAKREEEGDDSKMAVTPKDLRKASPSLYKEFLYSDEMDVVQFLKDNNNLDMVLESMDQVAYKEDKDDS